MKARALTVSIFEDKRLGNCSNHGISELYNEILLLCEDGPHEVDLDNPPKNLCRLVPRILWGEKHYYIEPCAKPEGVGYMYGGAVVYSSDSRFARLCGNTPLCLHDRQESQEMHDLLSH